MGSDALVVQPNFLHLALTVSPSPSANTHARDQGREMVIGRVISQATWQRNC
jgi:hypothetical protein